MKTGQRYEMETLKTVNNFTGNATYYTKICGEFVRVSKAEYEQNRDQCFGVSCLYNTTSKKYNRFYTTLSFYI